MTFQLKHLGPYRIERSEDWSNDPDNSYAEMIRVRESKSESPMFLVPSHLYKYSETELGLYLKERKHAWKVLGRLLNVKISMQDQDIMVHFPISRFQEVAAIVPFVRKALRKTPYTEDEKQKMVLNLHKGRIKTSGGIPLNGSNSTVKGSGQVNTPISPDGFNSGDSE